MVVDEVIDLEVEYADGETATITGTHEHPFYVPAVDRYVKLGELEPGTVLRTDAGGEAVVVDLTRHAGEFQVFNIEVAEAHNYFVRGAGFDGPGVLVHNKAVESALKIARDGGKHKGFLKQAEGMTSAQRGRTSKSLQKQIEKHEAKIDNPADFVDDWDGMSPQHQEGLVKHWQKEIDNFTKQQQILHALE